MKVMQQNIVTPKLKILCNWLCFGRVNCCTNIMLLVLKSQYRPTRCPIPTTSLSLTPGLDFNTIILFFSWQNLLQDVYYFNKARKLTYSNIVFNIVWIPHSNSDGGVSMGCQIVDVTWHSINFTWHELVQIALNLIYGNAEFRKFSSLFCILFHVIVYFKCLRWMTHCQQCQCKLCYPQRRIS